ncbi:LacI family DNA-binding transcriptional regulator [Flindersiella endophytica]
MPGRVDRQNPTLADVAALAGVSHMTVSRVINKAPHVSEHTRQLVEQAIAQTGYVAHHAGRSLVTRRTNSVAFVVAESQQRFFDDPVFGAMMLGANERLAAEGMQLVSIVCTTEADHARASQYIRGGHVDGALLASFRRGDPLLYDLATAHVPVVMAGRPPRSRRIPYVDVDNRQAARDIVKHLAVTGSRRIATITGPLDMSSGKHRLQGFLDLLELESSSELVARGEYTRASGHAAMLELLGRVPDLDAVFAANDSMAAGALDALRAAGRRVPDDVRVAGFDDSPIATATRPQLTTVRQPLDEIGRNMADLIVRQIAGSTDVGPVILPTSLIIRESA